MIISDETVNASHLAAALETRFAAPGHAACARIAGEIATAAARPSATALIPLLDRVERRDPVSWLETAHAYPIAPGIVVLAEVDPRNATHRRGYAEILLAAANGFVSQPGKSGLPDLAFRFERRNACATDLTKLLRLYKLPVPSDLPGGEFGSVIEVSIPGEDLAAWYACPRERTTLFYQAFATASTAMQNALRRWLRFAWFADLRNFDNQAVSRALMMYWLSPTCSGRSRSEFSWDVLNNWELNRLYVWSTGRADRELKEIGARLSRAGLDLSASAYQPLRRREIVAAVRREGRGLNRLIALESNVIDTLTTLAAEARLLPTPGIPLTGFEFANRYMHTLRTHLRREPLPDWSHDLAILVLIHATTALRAKLELPSGIRARLTIDAGAGARVSEVNARENLPEPLALAS